MMVQLYESWAKGGVLHNASLSMRHTSGTTVDIFSFARPLTNAQEKAMREEAVKHLGKNYDFKSVLRFLTRRDAPPDDNASLFCSEYAMIICLAGQLELLARTPPWIVPPDWIPRSPLLKFSETVVTV